MAFLPMTKKEIEDREWGCLDFIFISGDAYVDHPSFGHAIITRVLESKGYKVGIIAQPDWRDTKDFSKLGKPRLGFLVSSGVIDSMVNHYTAAKRPRGEDLYSPGGKKGLRPDRAIIVYCNRIREAFQDVPIIVGGIEASLRRFAHYDYWEDKVRRSILLDSKADIISFGMGEKSIVEVAELLDKGVPIKKINHVRGTAFVVNKEKLVELYKTNKFIYTKLPAFEEVIASKMAYAKAFKVQYEEQDAVTGKALVQAHGERYVVQNSPAQPLSVKEMDNVYALPYERTYHPSYELAGGVPAISEVKFSITSQRGCFGGCSFCALHYHQGKIIQKRSKESIVTEAKKITWLEDFKGYINDVGGPTANFRNPACKKQLEKGACKNKQCLYPFPCKNLFVSHEEYLNLLRELRDLPKVKKVFIRSGIRFDYLMADKDDTFFKELCKYHVSGQLKVAPEHVSEKVLSRMGKPSVKVYEAFSKKYKDINNKLKKEQYLVPYLMSSHPGSGINEAIELALYLKKNKYKPEQVQDFYPTPATLSTCMFYTGIDPRSLTPVYVAKDIKEKELQRALLQSAKPENRKLVMEALKKTGREDLIGTGEDCLISPYEYRTRNKSRGLDNGKIRTANDGKNKKLPKESGRGKNGLKEIDKRSNMDREKKPYKNEGKRSNLGEGNYGKDNRWQSGGSKSKGQIENRNRKPEAKGNKSWTGSNNSRKKSGVKGIRK